MKTGSLEGKYKSFFGLLENSFKEEFKRAPFPVLRVLNNYELKNEYNVSVEVTLNDSVKLCVICDTTFPNTDKPKVFCSESYNSPIIDKKTREINYSSFYQWTGKSSKVIDLVIAISEYFKKNKPVKNVLMEENMRKINDIKELTHKRLSNVNPTVLENQIPQSQREELWDSTTCYEVIQQAPEIRDLKVQVSGVIDKGLFNAGLINRRNKSKACHY